MKRYAALDENGALIRRVFAMDIDEAFTKARELSGTDSKKIARVVEEPMAQITRGD